MSRFRHLLGLQQVVIQGFVYLPFAPSIRSVLETDGTLSETDLAFVRSGAESAMLLVPTPETDPTRWT